MIATWHPETYLQFADQRSRPFFDLVGAVGAVEPRMVVDLGCGPGQLTATLAKRWPLASVVGVDSSEQMIAAAVLYSSDTTRFELADVATWRPSSVVDLIVSNATLQWIPDHQALLPRFVSWLSAPARTRSDWAVCGRDRGYCTTTRSRRCCELPGGTRQAWLRGRRLGDDVPPCARGRRPSLSMDLRNWRSNDLAMSRCRGS